MLLAKEAKLSTLPMNLISLKTTNLLENEAESESEVQ